MHTPVAQRREHCPAKAGVAGSNPAGRARRGPEEAGYLSFTQKMPARGRFRPHHHDRGVSPLITTRERRRPPMTYLTKLRAAPYASSEPIPGHHPGAEPRRRLRLGRRRLGAPAPLPDPRLRGRVLLRGRADADARERDGRLGAASRPTARARCDEIVAISPRGPRGEERRRRSSRWRWRPRRPRTRRASSPLDALPQVCRTGTHLFAFARYVEQFRGWGRSLRRGVGAWYAASRRTGSPTRRSSTASARARATATCCASPTRARRPARATRACPSATSTRGCSSGSSAAARRPACRASSRASRPRRARDDARRRRRALDPRVRPAARGGQAGAPRQRRGVDGAARAACR